MYQGYFLPRNRRGPKAQSKRVVSLGTKADVSLYHVFLTVDQALVMGMGLSLCRCEHKMAPWETTGLFRLLAIPKRVKNCSLSETSYQPSCTSLPIPRIRTKHKCQQHIFSLQAGLICTSLSLTETHEGTLGGYH